MNRQLVMIKYWTGIDKVPAGLKEYLDTGEAPREILGEIRDDRGEFWVHTMKS